MIYKYSSILFQQQQIKQHSIVSWSTVSTKKRVLANTYIKCTVNWTILLLTNSFLFFLTPRYCQRQWIGRVCCWFQYRYVEFMSYLQYINKFRFKVPHSSLPPCSLNKLIFIIFYLCCKWGWICKLCHGLVRSRIHILNYNKLNLLRFQDEVQQWHQFMKFVHNNKQKKMWIWHSTKHCYPHTLVLIFSKNYTTKQWKKTEIS